MDADRSSKNEHKKKTEKMKHLKWAFLSTILTFCLSYLINFISEVSISNSGIAIALLVLLCIVFIGILFDVLGTAVTAADEAPFHSMAARRVKGATKGIMLLKNAERVSNICNDIVGDICGIVSGSTSAVIVAEIFINKSAELWGGIAVSACVAAITVGGKALGKGIAIANSNAIVFTAAKILSVFEKEKRHGSSKKNS